MFVMNIALLSFDDLKQQVDIELTKAVTSHAKSAGFYSKRLQDSLVYALSSGGKRIRPLLVSAMALTHSRNLDQRLVVKVAMPVALAVEFIHTYSLIHDDLPAMDNDDFRRGKPSLHRQFDEALAILAGDALLSDAFSLAASAKNNPVAICQELAIMAGSRGLVAGQAEDLNRDNIDKDLACWLSINQAKTARMFEACAVTGALCANAPPPAVKKARIFGQAFGTAFQIADDLTDQAGSAMAANTEQLKELFHQHIAVAKNTAKTTPNGDMLLSLIEMTF